MRISIKTYTRASVVCVCVCVWGGGGGGGFIEVDILGGI